MSNNKKLGATSQNPYRRDRFLRGTIITAEDMQEMLEKDSRRRKIIFFKNPKTQRSYHGPLSAIRDLAEYSKQKKPKQS